MSNVAQMKWHHVSLFFPLRGFESNEHRPCHQTCEHLKPVKVTPWLITGTALDCISKLLWIFSKEMLRALSSSQIRLHVQFLSNEDVQLYISSIGCNRALLTLDLDAAYTQHTGLISQCLSCDFCIDPPLGPARLGSTLLSSLRSVFQDAEHHIKEIPWIQMSTVFGMEKSFMKPSTSWHPFNVQEGP